MVKIVGNSNQVSLCTETLHVISYANLFKNGLICKHGCSPKLANILTRIYPLYPWHFATLTAETKQNMNVFESLNYVKYEDCTIRIALNVQKSVQKYHIYLLSGLCSWIVETDALRLPCVCRLLCTFIENIYASILV